MIDQQLAIDILNNLLDTTVSNEASASSAEREEVLSSNYVTNTDDLDNGMNFEIELQVAESGNTPDGKRYTSSKVREIDSTPTSQGTNYEYETSSTLSSTSERDQLISEIESGFSRGLVNTKTEKIMIHIPLKSVRPTENKIDKEKEYVHPFGIDDSMANFLTNLQDGIYYNKTDDESTSNNLVGISNNVKERFENLKSELLKNFESYKASALDTLCSYEKKNGQWTTIPTYFTKTVSIKSAIKRKDTYTYNIKYKTSSSSSTQYQEHTYIHEYYKIEDKPVTIKIPCYFYAQSFPVMKFYPQSSYIGLFTKMPEKDGTGFIEPPLRAENLEGGLTYKRMSLHEGLFSGGYVFNKIKESNNDSYLGYAYLNNKEIIMFPEILLEEGWGDIVGFGVFENEYPVEGEKPFFWGRVLNEQGEMKPVPTSEGQVPLFRPNQFEVFLG